jgi:hypothetical protein
MADLSKTIFCVLASHARKILSYVIRGMFVGATRFEKFECAA